MARIMIVEDSRVIGGMLTVLVECAGHAVTWATGGEEALAQLARCEHDVLFVDVNMPGMDGFALVSKVRSLYPKAVYVFMTGETDPGHRAKGMKLGALEFVHKPIRFDDFKLVLKRAVHRAERTRAAPPAAAAVERVHERLAEDLELLLPGAPLAPIRSQLAEFALARRHSLIEAPAGMLTPELLQLMHRSGPFAAGVLVVHDAAAEPLTGVEELLASAPEGLVVLANLDAVPAGLQHALALQLRSTDRIRLVATVSQRCEVLKADGRLSGPLAAHLALCQLTLAPLCSLETKLPEIFAAALPKAPGYPHGRQAVEIEREAAHALSSYAWPGNMAELWELAGRLAPRLREPRLTLAELPESFCGTHVPRLEQQLRSAEAEHVRRALRVLGSVSAAAKALGVAPAALEAYQRSGATESLFAVKGAGRASARAKVEPAERLLVIAGDETVRCTVLAHLAEKRVEAVAVADGLAAVAALLLAPRPYGGVLIVPPIAVWQAEELGAQLLRIRPQLRLGLLGAGAVPPFHAAAPAHNVLETAVGELARACLGANAS
ncbi:MAG: response regulator [Opitutaceae bacterium]